MIITRPNDISARVIWSPSWMPNITRFNVLRFQLGQDHAQYGNWYTDSVHVMNEDKASKLLQQDKSYSDSARVEGFALKGPGLLNFVEVKNIQYCDENDKDTACEDDQIADAVGRK